MKFPQPGVSLHNLAQKIRLAGLRPGLWLAPFACDKSSSIASAHPDWVLKRNGSETVPANSANCGKWFYGLDVTNREVQRHVQHTIEAAVKDWNIRYLKLDVRAISTVI